MKKQIIYFMLMGWLLPLAVWAQPAPVMGTVLLNGKEIPAEYVVSGSTASLGSSRNACIPQYSEGRVIVPAKISVDGREYNVTAVSNMAFRLCGGITFVQLPEGVKRIGNFAFKSCKGLLDVKLPSTLESIGSGAFVGLTNLRAIYCQAETPPRWEYNDVFCRHEGGIGSTKTYSNSTTTLYVPLGTTDAYRNSTFSDADLGWTTPDGWRYFTNVKEANDYETEWGLGISTPLALNEFRERVDNGETFDGKIVKVEADIDMQGETWGTGIGERLGYFKGTLDGQRHTISNLKINIPDQNSNIQRLGFFGYIVDATITNLRLDNFYVISQSKMTAAGVLAGWAMTSTISNCYVRNSQATTGGNAGGLVGSATGTDISKCVVEGTHAVHGTDGETFDAYNGVGGLVGVSNWVTIRNCAVIHHDRPTGNYDYCVKGPFVGRGEADVDYCYTDATQFDNWVPTDQNGYTHGEHVVVYGQQVYFALSRQNRPITTALMKNFMALVPYLGLDNWVYCVGQYPLPDCFEDLYDVKANHFSLRPATLTTPRPNALVLTEELSYDDWTSGDYRNASFKASSLWIDDNLSYDDREQVPIGTATIDCTNGVRYDRTLTAPENGTKTTEYPVYQTDEDGRIVFDENGQRIPTGETMAVEETVYKPTPYCFYLPYPLTFSNGVRLYQPTTLTVGSNNVAQALFVEQADPEARAWTPYYVVVDNAEVLLSTEEHVVLTPKPEGAGTVDVGNGYIFAGSSEKLKRTRVDGYLLQSDETWRKTSDDILPFRSYFYTNNSSPASYITMLTKLMGDVDKSGTVDVGDVTALVDIILGKDNAAPFLYDHEAADMNGDGQLTIVDVTMLVSRVLDQ